MPKTSAGLLPYRRGASGIEVLLVHPGGPFWARRDEGAWSIAKGEVEGDEEALAAARREFVEETGFAVPKDAEAIALAPRRQPGGKVVIAWAMPMDVDPAALVSNTFEMEWPPRSGTLREFPEVDRAAWFPLAEAGRKILPGQVGFLDELERVLCGRGGAGGGGADPGSPEGSR